MITKARFSIKFPTSFDISTYNYDKDEILLAREAYDNNFDNFQDYEFVRLEVFDDEIMQWKLIEEHVISR